MIPRHITIIGLGLIGGSLGMALRRQKGGADDNGIDNNVNSFGKAVLTMQSTMPLRICSLGLPRRISYFSVPVLQIVLLTKKLRPILNQAQF